MRYTRVGRSWNRNKGEGFVLDSHGAAGRDAGGPSPPEVEAAEMARYIHYFANKEETGDFVGEAVLVHEQDYEIRRAVIKTRSSFRSTSIWCHVESGS